MSDDDDDDDDDANDMELELNRKVATVMQPLMKKLKKQSQKMESLQKLCTEQGARLKELESTLPSQVQELGRSLESAMDRTRRDLGERVLHADHARVEVSLTGGLASMQHALEEARTKAAASELLANSLQARLDEMQAASRRSFDSVDERVASLREKIADEATRAESRRSELQLHLA